jgi:hypothetical protein
LQTVPFVPRRPYLSPPSDRDAEQIDDRPTETLLATFLLGGAVAGVAYNVVRGHLAPINFATGAIFGLMIASGIPLL